MLCKCRKLFLLSFGKESFLFSLVFLCVPEPLRQLDSRLGPKQQEDLAMATEKTKQGGADYASPLSERMSRGIHLHSAYIRNSHLMANLYHYTYNNLVQNTKGFSNSKSSLVPSIRRGATL